ncbi:MAG: sulfur carrier protein ThiS [Gemmatimonadota bacterium]
MTSQTALIGVRINGSQRELAGGQNVAELLLSLGLHPRLIVVERNGEILRHERYESVNVEDGDRLELVHFVGGG